MDPSEKDQPPRPSDPGDVHYVPPSLIPRPLSLGEQNLAPIRLARDIDPRQQTTRRVMVFRRWWLRHRWSIRLALTFSVALVSVVTLIVLVSSRSAAPAAPEPRTVIAPPETARRVSAPPPPPSQAPPTVVSASGLEAPAPPEPIRSAKARARQVWLE